MKKEMAKQIAKQLKKLPKEKKEEFIKMFKEKNAGNPDLEVHLAELKKAIGYEDE